LFASATRRDVTAIVPAHLSVARAEEKDLSTLAALRFQWRVDEAGESGLSHSEFEERFVEWYARHRDTHYGYLVSIHGVAVGCAWLFVVDRVPGPGRFVRRAGMLQSVYVQPLCRNAGVGSELMHAIIDDSKAMKLDYLMVHPSAASFEFYRRLGFYAADRALELRLT
jgi:GNAT superfamily N-acetyltransferase